MPSMTKEPLPPGESSRSVQAKQPSAERTADRPRQRNRDHEPRARPRAHRRRIPLAQVVHDRRKESGFGDAEQKAQHVELRRRAHEHHRRRRCMPHVIMMRAIHRARADAHEHEVARHLEQRVADEEDSGAEAERRAR